MDWPALALSLRLAAWTLVLLLPLAILLARLLAWHRFRLRGLVLTLVSLPLVLPPTVLGFYLLQAFSPEALPGALWQRVFGQSLAFSFPALVVAALLFNLPFAVQPVQRAFERIPANLREAAWLCGMSRWRTFLRIELPLAWPGITTAAVLVFAHTLGEFGVVLMVGGNIPEDTRTVSIAIYDSVQSFNDEAAALMAAGLLLIAFAALALINGIEARVGRHERD